jgi:hypothetical protein
MIRALLVGRVRAGSPVAALALAAPAVSPRQVETSARVWPGKSVRPAALRAQRTAEAAAMVGVVAEVTLALPGKLSRAVPPEPALARGAARAMRAPQVWAATPRVARRCRTLASTLPPQIW